MKNISRLIRYTLKLFIASVVTRISSKRVYFAVNGRLPIPILLHLSDNSCHRIVTTSPRISEHNFFLARAFYFITVIALKVAEVNRLVFVIYGSDMKRFQISLKDLGCNVEYLERGLLEFHERDGTKIISYIRDSKRPYFDGRGLSELEELLLTTRYGSWRHDPILVAFLNASRESKLQKYKDMSFDGEINHLVGKEDLLVVGQVWGDAAWTETKSLVRDNVELVVRAHEDYGHDRRVFYKPHPYNPNNNVDCKKINALHPNIEIISNNIPFRYLLKEKPIVVVNTSGAGLEALLEGSKVICYGISFYSGWGATEDRFGRLERRNNSLSSEDIYITVMAKYVKYIYENDHKSVPIEEIVKYL